MLTNVNSRKKYCWLGRWRGWNVAEVLCLKYWTLSCRDLPLPKSWESRHNIIQLVPHAYSSFPHGYTKVLSTPSNRCPLAGIAFLTPEDNITAWPLTSHQSPNNYWTFWIQKFTFSCPLDLCHVVWVYFSYNVEIWSANVLAA